MEATQRTSGALSSPFCYPVEVMLLLNKNPDRAIDRALADVSQLVRRFENILSYAPVSELFRSREKAFFSVGLDSSFAISGLEAVVQDHDYVVMRP